MNWNETLDEDSITIPCPHCNEQVYEDLEQCPYCQNFIISKSNPFQSKPVWFQRLVVLIVVLTLIGLLLTSLMPIF